MRQEVLSITVVSYGKLNAMHSPAKYAGMAVNGAMFSQIIINGAQLFLYLRSSSINFIPSFDHGPVCIDK
jgi:hypothetical protein